MRWNKTYEAVQNGWKAVMAGCAFLALSACGSALGLGGDTTPVAIYDLVLPPQGDRAASEAEKVLFLEPLTYPAFLRTDKIAVKPDEQEIRYLAGARWQDRHPDLLGRYLVVSLESVASISVIDGDDTAREHQYRLNVDVRDFSAHIEGMGAPVAHVAVAADLMETSPLRVISKRSFSRRVPADANTKDAIVRAFNDATEGVTADLLAWIEAETQ